jgi:hypothetical protein
MNNERRHGIISIPATVGFRNVVVVSLRRNKMSQNGVAVVYIFLQDFSHKKTLSIPVSCSGLTPAYHTSKHLGPFKRKD